MIIFQAYLYGNFGLKENQRIICLLAYAERE